MPIVEGHGEDAAIRILLERLGNELLGGSYIEVLRPLRWPKSKLVQEPELRRAVDLACRKLLAGPEARGALLLIIVDADRDAPCILGPKLLARARASGPPNVAMSCVVANVEFETWFVAAAESLCAKGYFSLSAGETIPQNPESSRSAGAWVQRHFKGTRYSKTLDQPALTHGMDLHACRARSPSFDKLCRDLQLALDAVGSLNDPDSPRPGA
jgi:hypothetical protein